MPPGIDEPVVQDPQQPAPAIPVRRKLGRLARRLLANVLHEVFGIGTVAGQAVRDAEDVPHVGYQTRFVALCRHLGYESHRTLVAITSGALDARRTARSGVPRALLTVFYVPLPSIVAAVARG